MKKSILAIILVLAMVLMIGCASTQAVKQRTSDETKDQPNASASESSSVDDEAQTIVGITTLDMSNPFFIELVEGAQNFADAHGVRLLTNDCQNNSEKQISAIENFISSGCQSIIVCAVDANALSNVLTSAKEKGIKIVSVFEQPEADVTLGSDDYTLGYKLGEAAGRWISKNLADQETVQAAIFNYDKIASVINRRQGIEDGLKANASNVDIVASVEANEPAPGLDAAETLLQAYPDLQCILGINDAGVIGAYEAFAAKGVDESKYILGGIDATPDGLAKVAEGGMFRVTVDQQPYNLGERMVEESLNLINGDPTQPIVPDYLAVTEENIADFVD